MRLDLPLGFAIKSMEREKALVPTLLNAIRDAGVKAEVTANMVEVTRVAAFILRFVSITNSDLVVVVLRPLCITTHTHTTQKPS